MIVERGFLDHWKTNLLRQRTGLPNASELPLRLWEYCESRMDDFIADPSGDVIAGICRSPLPPKELLAALIACRWVEKIRGGFLVRGWRERQKGKFASRLNGAKGGRPKKDAAETHSEPDQNPQVSNPEPAENLNHEQVNQQGGERRGEEKSREPADPPPRRGAWEGVAGDKILAETTRSIFQLFPAAKKRTRLGREAEGELARQVDSLPLEAGDWQRLAWWLALPTDERDPYLREGSRPKDPDRLALRLFETLDRASAHAEKTGAAKKETAPAGWEQWWAERYQEKPCPASFDALPEYLRDDCRRDLKGVPA